mgnify:CR=1 FL=1
MGRLDEEGQQVDLRAHNSWTLGLQEVPLRELLQTLTINSVAPFLLISRQEGLVFILSSDIGTFSTTRISP